MVVKRIFSLVTNFRDHPLHISFSLNFKIFIPLNTGNDYAVVYEMEVLPKDVSSLGEKYEKGTLNENEKW